MRPDTTGCCVATSCAAAGERDALAARRTIVRASAMLCMAAATSSSLTGAASARAHARSCASVGTRRILVLSTCSSILHGIEAARSEGPRLYVLDFVRPDYGVAGLRPGHRSLSRRR
jgi:hypothetical protein